MPDQYRRRAADVTATQYTGGEDSAAAVIAWAAALPRPIKLETYPHRPVGAHDRADTVLEIWLKVRGAGMFLAPSDWLVIEGGGPDIYTAPEFEREYELSEATA